MKFVISILLSISITLTACSPTHQEVRQKLVEAEKCATQYFGVEYTQDKKRPPDIFFYRHTFTLDGRRKGGGYSKLADFYILIDDPPDWLIVHEATHRVLDLPFILEEPLAKEAETVC